MIPGEGVSDKEREAQPYATPQFETYGAGTPGPRTPYGVPRGDDGYDASSVFTDQPYPVKVTVNEALQEEYADKPIPDYFVLSLLVICCNPLCGIVAAVFAAKAKASKRSGDYESAEINGKLALALSTSAIFSGLMLYTFLVLYFTIFAYALFNPYEDFEQ